MTCFISCSAILLPGRSRAHFDRDKDLILALGYFIFLSCHQLRYLLLKLLWFGTQTPNNNKCICGHVPDPLSFSVSCGEIV